VRQWTSRQAGRAIARTLGPSVGRKFSVYNKDVGGDFRWNQWNLAHVARHGIAPEQAEFAITGARPPYPSYEGDVRWLVRGRDARGRFIQVVYVVDADGDTLYVIHARPLNDREKRNLRRRRR
jgi:uncharacterized DUF497 family protein